MPLFERFHVEDQLRKALDRRVYLKSGGLLVIDRTEALTVIDVNTGKFVGKSSLEETVLHNNLEAAEEIGRQLRLRDIGGIIVSDFIDMASTRNRKKVEKAMKDALKGDKARHDVTPISKLGLMEIARQRIKGEKMGASYATCPACEGYGLIKNVEAAALAALRKLQTRSGRRGVGVIKLKLPTEVATWKDPGTAEPRRSANSPAVGIRRSDVGAYFCYTPAHGKSNSDMRNFRGNI